MKKYLRYTILLNCFFLMPVSGAWWPLFTTRESEKTFEWEVYEQVAGSTSSDMDEIVDANRGAFEKNVKGKAVFQKRKALFTLGGNKKEEGKLDYYQVKDIKFKDGKGTPQLTPDMLKDIWLRYDNKNFHFLNGNVGPNQAHLAHQYAMFWHGKPMYQKEELENVKNNPSIFLNNVIREARGLKKDTKPEDFPLDVQNNMNILRAFNLFSFDFTDFSQPYRFSDYHFPTGTKAAFKPTLKKIFSHSKKYQAAHIISEIWKEYPTRAAIFNEVLKKAPEIRQELKAAAEADKNWGALFARKWELLHFLFLVAVGGISIIKVGNFLWAKLLKWLFPISYLPPSVLKQYTREKNIIIRWADRYLGPKGAQRVRRFMARRGWWRALPVIRVDLVIYPDDLTEEYVQGLIEDIRYIIKANKALIARGKEPIYFLPNIIFYGKPGNGKTRICQMIISVLRSEGLIESCEANIPQLAKLDIRDSALFWEEIGSKESAERPLGIILNEFDDIAIDRYSGGTDLVKRTHLNSYLSLFDDKGSPYRFCLITMNMKLDDEVERGKLDAAFLNRCKEFKIGSPNKENRIRILLLHLREQGKPAHLYLTGIAFLKEELAKHPLFDLKDTGRDYADIANKVIIQKDKERRKRRSSKKKESEKKEYIVLQDILEVLDRELEIAAHNQAGEALPSESPAAH